MSDKKVFMQIRIPEHEREAFIRLCKDSDTTAAREIRAFIRNELKKNAQQSLL